MLLYKAWVETRMRFFAGLIAAAIICSYYVYAHSSLVAMWTHDLQDRNGYHFSWMSLGVSNYDWYLWHYLYDNYLQQIWSLFAVLFAFGGLVREKQSGTVLFSLSLPVSRRWWLFTRLLVAVLESIALACFAALVVAIGSILIHQNVSMRLLLSHTVLMVSVGLFAIALGNIFYTLFPGHYVSLIFILAVIGAPYLVIQNYMQHMRYLHRSTWLAYLDFGHAMAGPWQLTWSTVPWVTLSSTIFITFTLVAAAVFYGDRIDY